MASECNGCKALLPFNLEKGRLFTTHSAADFTAGSHGAQLQTIWYLQLDGMVDSLDLCYTAVNDVCQAADKTLWGKNNRQIQNLLQDFNTCSES